MVHIGKMSSSSREQELAQRLYDKNVELENKRRRSAQARVPSDPNAWQQMRENYEAIILEDHNFSEQHNIEYALWQLHYRRIEEFRAHLSSALASSGSTTSHGGRVPTRPDRITKLRLQFKTFLSEATGFYHDLILKVRAKNGLPLGDFEDSDGERSVETKKGLISCHRCLIYLGDLARYKGLYGEGGDSKSGDYAAASSYYLQAASLWPPSGNPHHQLAILATYSGDEFVAVYRYFRSLAVDSPFSTARDNLIVAFEKNRQSYSQLEEDAKSSTTKELSTRATVKGRGKAEVRVRPKDSKNDTTSIPESFKAFCVRFVRLNGILFTRTSLETSVEVLSVVNGALHELLSSGQEEDLNFGKDAENGLFIVRLIAILIFTVHNVSREAKDQTYADIVQRNLLLQNSLTAVFELMGLILKRCIELYDPSSSYLLPGILIFVEWLASCASVVVGSDAEDKQATVRTTFWNRCILLLNKLLSNGLGVDDEDETCFFNMSQYEEGETENRLALWEDFELRGFTPLQPAQTILNFSRKHSFGGDRNKEKLARVKRILAAGKALADVVKVDQKEFRFDSKLKKFVIGVEPLALDDCKLTPYSGSPKLISKIQDTRSTVVQPKGQLDVEGDEEDEEIVFKPIVTEKRGDVIGSKWTHYEGLEAGQNVFAGDSQFYGSSVSGPHFSSQLPLSVAKISPQNMHSIESHSSMSLVDQQPSLANGLNGLSILENGHVMKPGIRDVNTPFAALISSSTQQSGSVNVNDVFNGQEKVPENVIQSNIDFISSSIVNSRTSSVLAASSRKSTFHRPVRHLGPPPGFCSVPPKQVNVPTSASDMRGENPQIDDYSWLDGYQLPSSMRNFELNQIINQSSHLSRQYISNENGSAGPINFLFPGKQVPSMLFQVETQKGWQDHQTLERVNLNHEQLLQPRGSEQFPVADQYQGLSIWEGRRFV